MILSETWEGSFYVCLTEPPGFIPGEHQEALLVLEIESLGDRSNKVKNQRLELHFEEESRVYICSMVYNLSDKGYNPSEGRYRKLNVREIEYLRKYINDNVLNFII